MESTDPEIVNKTECMNILRKYFATSKISDFKLVSYNIQRSQATGGLLGQYYNLTVQVAESDDRARVLHFFIKRPHPPDTVTGMYTQEGGHFQKEVYIYNNIFPKILKNLDDSIVPECYLGIPGRMIVLEDLATKGFIVMDKMVPLELEYCEVVLTALAKFHAQSIIYEETSAETIPHEFACGLFEIWCSKEYEKSVQKYSAMVRGLIFLVELMDNIDGPAKAKFKAKIEEMAKTHSEFLLPSKTCRNVLCHGDLWANNVLFRVQTDGKPDSCCFVDFQLLRYTPPTLDILYFLQCTTTREFRRQHSLELYQLYHRILSKSLSDANLNPTEIFPIEDLLKSIEAYRKSSLFHGILNLPAMLIDGKKIAKDYRDQFTYEFAENLYLRDRSLVIRNQFYGVDAYRTRMVDAVMEFYDEFVV